MNLRIPALLIALALPAATWAQAYPAKDLLDTSTTIIGETISYPQSGPARVKASIVTIAPGADTAFHHHPAPMFAYVLEGEVTVDYGAAGKRVIHQGEALMEAMNTSHRGRNLGTTPVRILAVHMGAEGTANVALDK